MNVTHRKHRKRRPHHVKLQEFFAIVPDLRETFLSSKFDLGPASIKGQYVYAAIERELNRKGFNPPHDDSWAMDDGYGYGDQEIRQMLVNVAGYLHDHGYFLKLSENFFLAARKETLEKLRTDVSDKTSVIK